MSEESLLFGESLANCIEEAGDCDWKRHPELNKILQGLQAKSVSEFVIISWLKGCEDILFHSCHCGQFVDLLLETISWVDGKKFSKAYSKFVVFLTSSFPSIYTQKALRTFIYLFNTVLPEDGQVLYNLIDTTLQTVPMSSTIFLQEVERNYPYLSAEKDRQVNYMSHLLSLIDKYPGHKSKFIEILLAKLLDIDVSCPRDDIEEEEEDSDDNDDGIFEMEVEGELGMKNPTADTLDVLLNILFDYINRTFTIADDGPSKSLVSTFKHFLKTFVDVVLGSQLTTHVQFIMFHLCSLHQTFTHMFLKSMWNVVESPSEIPKLRINAACYMAGLLCRAMFVDLKTCLSWMERFSTRLHNYTSNHTEKMFDSRIHFPFYSLFQALLYVFVFRHREILDKEEGFALVRRIHFQSLVSSNLNPLRPISTPIVTKFSSIARNYQICYCYAIIEHNERMSNSCLYFKDGVIHRIEREQLHPFFPFDPYLLKRSSVHINPSYQRYLSTEELEEVKAEDYDFLETSTDKNNLNEMFDYSKSPGFHISWLDV